MAADSSLLAGIEQSAFAGPLSHNRLSSALVDANTKTRMVMQAETLWGYYLIAIAENEAELQNILGYRSFTLTALDLHLGNGYECI